MGDGVRLRIPPFLLLGFGVGFHRFGGMLAAEGGSPPSYRAAYG